MVVINDGSLPLLMTIWALLVLDSDPVSKHWEFLRNLVKWVLFVRKSHYFLSALTVPNLRRGPLVLCQLEKPSNRSEFRVCPRAVPANLPSSQTHVLFIILQISLSCLSLLFLWEVALAVWNKLFYSTHGADTPAVSLLGLGTLHLHHKSCIFLILPLSNLSANPSIDYVSIPLSQMGKLKQKQNG